MSLAESGNRRELPGPAAPEDSNPARSLWICLLPYYSDLNGFLSSGENSGNGFPDLFINPHKWFMIDLGFSKCIPCHYQVNTYSI